jgi:hypothetical protein
MSEGNNLPLTPPEAEAYWCGRYLLELYGVCSCVEIEWWSTGQTSVLGRVRGSSRNVYRAAPTLPEALEAAVKELKEGRNSP